MSTTPPPITRLAAAADSPGTRTRRWWIIGLIAAALLGASLLPLLTQQESSTQTGHPHNPDAAGAQAAATVLSDHGVRVDLSETTDTTVQQEQDTIVIVGPNNLDADQYERIAAMGTDLVLVPTSSGLPPDLDVERESYGSQDSVPAECSYEHAEAAGEISAQGPVFTGPSEAQVCFGPDDAEEGGWLLNWSDGDRSITVVPMEILLNRSLAEDGNAALTFRILGASDSLTWMMASTEDDSGAGADPDAPVAALWAAALIMAVALLWWRMPRFGRLAIEPLPVVVKAAETTMGRGALYRRHRDVPHAARALRAAAVTRIGERIGMPSHANRAEVITWLAEATGRTPEAIDDVLYGPPPHDSAGLSALAYALDTLESEVHRR